MSLHQEIIDNINTRYVLLKKGYYYRIIDKLSGTTVIFTDPFINYKKLIRYMLDNDTKVYNSIKSLPEPTEKPIIISHDFLENLKKISVLKIFSKKIYSKNGLEIGTIMSALTDAHVNVDYKRRIEEKLIQFSLTSLYPNDGLKFYSENYYDTISLIVIKNFNDLPAEDLPTIETEILDW